MGPPWLRRGGGGFLAFGTDLPAPKYPPIGASWATSRRLIVGQTFCRGGLTAVGSLLVGKPRQRVKVEIRCQDQVRRGVFYI